VNDDRSCKAFRNLDVTGELYVSQRVAVPLVEAGVLKSDTLRPSVNPGVTVESDLHVIGMVSYGALLSPFWAAGKVDCTNMQVLSSIGRHPFTITRVSGFSAGIFKVTFGVPHPAAGHYIVASLITQERTFNYVREGAASLPTANSFEIVCFSSGNALTNPILHFTVLA